MMKKLVDRFGKLITASFFVIAAGIIVFLLVFPLYHFFKIDTDILGLIIIDIGVVILLIGIILRKKYRGFKLAALAVLAAVLSIPALFLVVGLVYYMFTGKPLG